MNCCCCFFYPLRIVECLYKCICCFCNLNYSEIGWRSILKLRDNRNIVLVNLIFGTLFVISLSLAVFLIVNGSTPLYLISWIPYLFIFGVVSLFGYPVPFSSPVSRYSDFIYDLDRMWEDDLKHFLICCFIPAPVALSLIFSLVKSETILVALLIIFSHITMIMSVLFVFIVYCSQAPKEIEEEFEMEIEEERIQ